jgi:toxin ParE1/3/4
MPRLVITNQADRDLLAISSYIADRNGKLRATKVMERIRKTMDNLASMPGMGRGRSYLPGGLRAFPSAPWTIVYDLLPEGDGINVVRVLHGRRDLSAIFGEDM